MKLIVLVAATALTTTAAFAQSSLDRNGWPESFTIGTGSQGGTYFGYGSAWGRLVAEELNVVGGAEVTGGPMPNMSLVHAGEIEFGMATMGPAAESVAGTNPVDPGTQMTNVCTMFPMYQTPFSMVALSSSGIASISDIPNGARIGFGPAGGTGDTYFPRMLQELGVNFERRNGGYSDLAGQMKDGLIDVMAVAAGSPVPVITQLESETEVNIIEFTAQEQEQIQARFPVANFEISADTYATLDSSARSVSMWNVAVANCDLPASFVNQIVDIVMSDNARMVSLHKAARSTLPENWDKNAGVLKWHPGAAQWFIQNANATIPREEIFGN